MNEKENEIITELLDTICQANEQDRMFAINCYSEFLNSVAIRLSIEAQQIENKRNQ